MLRSSILKTAYRESFQAPTVRSPSQPRTWYFGFATTGLSLQGTLPTPDLPRGFLQAWSAFSKLFMIGCCDCFGKHFTVGPDTVYPKARRQDWLLWHERTSNSIHVANLAQSD